MKQLTKYIAIGALSFGLGTQIVPQENMPVPNTQSIPQKTMETQNKNIPWELRKEENETYSLRTPTGRTSFERIICNKANNDVSCTLALNYAQDLIKLKEEISSTYAPTVPASHYRALVIEDTNNDGEVDKISWPVYTYTSRESPVFENKTLNSDLKELGKEALYLENIIQATLKYKL